MVLYYCKLVSKDSVFGRIFSKLTETAGIGVAKQMRCPGENKLNGQSRSQVHSWTLSEEPTDSGY